MGSPLSMTEIEDIKLSHVGLKNTIYGMVLFLSSLYIGYTLYY
uniref:Uncharacterized protein n=1 Tax=viral metagenome TaxID=1070528 RepID=A0A6C0J7V5_9ZZZZ